MKGRPSIAERWWAKFQREPGGCWLWTGAVDQGTGYGRFHVRPGRVVGAHRFGYELLVEPIPSGLELDHVVDRGCRNRHCVNPLHLEPVTHQENQLRGDTIIAAHAEGRDCGVAGCRNCQRFHSCTCPGPCEHCAPLESDDQADREYRATRHMFDRRNTTGRGLTPGRQ